MRQQSHAAVAALAATAKAATLADVCTVSNVQAALPSNGTLLGIDLLPSVVTASAVYNASAGMGSTATYNYCNVTVRYTHTGKNDEVVLKYAFPSPSDFENRFYVSGGGGYSLSSDATGGLAYGAASGATDGGYDAFDNSYDSIVLKGNGSINWDATYMFGFQALGEMTQVGKAITPSFYGLSNDTKIYTYFEGCSDGGREGMSQVQRWGSEYDGVVAGAPAFRHAQQQLLHLLPATIEHTLDYNPPPCALDKIVNATIAACDPLDGRTDGVVSRTDLCMLNFNLSSLIGESYYCAEEISTSLGLGFSKRQVSKRQAQGSTSSYRPAQNGTITAQDVAVAQGVYDGIINSKGERGYFSWQIASDLDEASPTYNNETGEWDLSISSNGGGYVTRFVELVDADNLSSLDNVTYDTLIDWSYIGMTRFLNSLQTSFADITDFQASGGKLLHYHGESDPSVPAASSVHYWQAVRSVMYGDLPDDQALAAISEWYQFYLVPGAAHCGSNSLQPGPYPQDNMNTIIDWVENGIKPTALNATVSSGDFSGEVQQLCQWPTRPLWHGNSSDFECVNDKASIDSWTYTLDAYKIPIY
ncbi:Tannase/feruloyl esterase [Camillea tinctor]|nr:Tannase/feruloyl esterase [Camillea tinctor]